MRAALSSRRKCTSGIPRAANPYRSNSKRTRLVRRVAAPERPAGPTAPCEADGTSSLLSGKNVAIVGGGPAGLLSAINLARHGAAVQVFEFRQSGGEQASNINVAPLVILQARGIRALKASGIDMSDVGPSLRFVGGTSHELDGSTNFNMGWSSEAPVMIGCDVTSLAGFIREQALRLHPNAISLRFGCKLVDGDLMAGSLEFEDVASGERFSVNCDLVVGADGGNSVVRRLMSDQVPGFAVDSQANAYSSVRVQMPQPPEVEAFSASGAPFKLFPPLERPGQPWALQGFTYAFCVSRPNAHGAFLALVTSPQGDFRGSWSMSTQFWHEHRSEAQLLDALREYYPQLPLVYAEAFAKAAVGFAATRLLPSSVKCSTLAAGKVVLVGDAAHSVSPTLGQGAQSSLEDAVCLSSAVIQAKGDVGLIGRLYSEARLPEVHALVDLDRAVAASRPGSTVSPWKRALQGAPAAASSLLCKWTANLPENLRPRQPFTNISIEPYSQVYGVMLRNLHIVASLGVGMALMLVLTASQFAGLAS